AHFNDLVYFTEEQLLGFNPANRRCELPGQQLNHEQASKGLLIEVFNLEVIQLAGRCQWLNLVDEFLGELEWRSHQVWYVTSNQRVQVEGFWQYFIELFSKRWNAAAQNLRVERHVNARNRDVCAVLDGIGLLLQRSQTCLGARDGVLLASDVVVDDF